MGNQDLNVSIGGKHAKRIACTRSSDLLKAMRKRNPLSDKRENGTVVLIGGSNEYHGAPLLAANAANDLLASLRIGAGYAELILPRSILAPARSASPNLVVKPAGKDFIPKSAVPFIAQEIARADAVIIGPGMGRRRSTSEAAGLVIKKCIELGKKVVIDADAIYAAASARKFYPDCIFTPQDHEFKALSGISLPKDDLEVRANAALETAQKFGAVIVLKGHQTLITDGTRIKLNRSRSAALATMGTGDVLSGIIGGFLAIGSDAFSAAIAGVYLHSKIGDMLYRRMGNHIIASDIVDSIPTALRRLSSHAKV